MELINTTFLSAGINVGTLNPLQPEVRAALVVAKATFREVSPGDFEPETDAPYPLYPEDLQTDAGILPRDDFPKFGAGADVIVMGRAYAPGGTPCTEMTVSLEIGGILRRLRVFGDRVWERTGGGLRISEPKPFSAMPLDYAHAYGGAAEYEYNEEILTVYYPHNFVGKGFIREEEKADGTPLPNIEDPEALISRWDDQPLPAAWSTMPLAAPLHGERGVSLEGVDIRIRPQFYCRASPGLVLTQLHPGEKVVLRGMCPDSEFSFAIPDWRVSALCRVGSQHEEQQAAPDTLVILPEERRFYLVYRFWFDFLFKPGVSRAVRLQADRQMANNRVG
jgi:hypothetical protein